jgi:putative ABC transport system permease protein
VAVRYDVMDHLLPDLRYAVASLRRTRPLTVTVLATLALGIGATTAVFTVK